MEIFVELMMSKQKGQFSTEEEKIKKRILQVIEQKNSKKIPLCTFWNEYRDIFHGLPDPKQFNLSKRSGFFEKFNDVLEFSGTGVNRCIKLKNWKTVPARELGAVGGPILPSKAVWGSKISNSQNIISKQKTQGSRRDNQNTPELLGSSSSEEDSDGLPEGFMASHPGGSENRKGENKYHPYAQTTTPTMMVPAMSAGNFYTQFAQNQSSWNQQPAYSAEYPLPHQAGTENRAQQRQRQQYTDMMNTTSRRRDDNYYGNSRSDSYRRDPTPGDRNYYGNTNPYGNTRGSTSAYGGRHSQNQENSKPIISVKKEELDAVAQDCIDRLSEAKEYVSCERIEKLIIQHYSSGDVKRLQDLGIRRIEDIKAVNDHVRKQCKVNAYITAFVKVRPIITLHELSESLQEFECEGQEFDKLKLGPLQKQPLVYEYFKFPMDSEIPDIGTWDVIDILRDYLSKKDLWRSRELNMQDFMMYIKDERSCESPYDTGVKIKSLPLAVQVLKRAQRDSSQNIKGVISQQKESIQDDVMAAFRHFGTSMLNKQVGYCEVKKEYLTQTALEVIITFSEKITFFYQQLNNWSEITRNERKMMNQMNEIRRNIVSMCSMNKCIEAIFRLAICCGKEEIHKELWGIIGKQFGGRANSDNVIVLDDDDEDEDEGNRMNISASNKPKPALSDVLKMLLKYLERCLAQGSLNLELLVKIENKLLDEFNFPYFVTMGHGSFLECMTQNEQIKKFLEDCGGSVLGGSQRGSGTTESLYQATPQDVQDFVRQCDIGSDSAQLLHLEQAICHHYKVKELKSLGQGTSKHLTEMANKSHRVVKNPSVFYEGALCCKNKGLSAVGDRQVGVLGHQTKEKALACLQNCPLLEDIVEWSQWDLVFQPQLGPIKEFLLKYGRVHNATVTVENGEKATLTTTVLAMETKPGTLLKLTTDTTAEKFAASSATGDVRNTCGHLVSLLVTNKGLDNLPTALLGNHMKTALLKMQAQYGINDEVPGGPSSRTKCSKVCEFVVECFTMLPFLVCQAIANKIFLEPLAHVIGSTKSKDQLLLAAQTTAQASRLQILGCALGISEWSRSFEKRLVYPRDNLQRVEKIEDGMGGVIEAIIESEDEDSDDEDKNKEDSGTIILSDDDDDICEDTTTSVEQIEIKDSETELSVEAMTIESDSRDGFQEDAKIESVDIKDTDDTIRNKNEDDIQTITDEAENINQCKTVVDLIRKEEFGIDVELSEDGKKLMLKQQERLGRSLDRLSKDLYSKDTHFVLELIQNADDNDYPYEMLSSGFDVFPSVEFLVENDCITVLNNECGFMEKNIRAICDVGRSTKGKHKFGYIGQKGIGFKSVFRVTDKPEIHSNGYHICFDVNSGPTGYILPHWLEVSKTGEAGCKKDENMEQEEESSMDDKWKTKIVLPLKDDVRSQHQTRSLAARFHDVHASLLLFLHRLRNLTVINKVEDYTIDITRRDLENNIIQIEHTGGSDSWLVVKKMLDASKISIQAKSGVEVESTEIALAFQLQTKEERLTQVLPQKQPVFAFLPLRSYGFRFVIQGDFDVPSSREDVDRDSMWNQWIRGEIHKLFVEALETFKAQPDLTDVDAVCSFLQFVPMDDEILEFFKPVASSILQQLRAQSCLPTQPTKNKGIQWKMPSQLVINKDSLMHEVITSELLQEHLNLDYLHQDVVHALNPSLCHSLGVQSLTTSHLMDIGKVFVDKLSAMDTDTVSVDRIADLQQLSKWLTCIYRSMDEFQPDQDIMSQLKQLPIIPLTNGEMIRLNEKTVFFPLADDRKQNKKSSVIFKLIAADINTVDSQLFSKLDDVPNSQVRKLMQMLGVKSLSPQDVIHHHIMPVLKSDLWQTKPRDILFAYVMYIKDQLDHDGNILSLDELRPYLIVLTNKGVKRPVEEPVHFTPAYLNKVNLEQELPGYRWLLLDAMYLKGVTTIQETMSWRHFFVKLGIIDYLALKSEITTVKWEDLDGSPWAAYKKVLPKMEQYKIADYECEEFMCLVAENTDDKTLYVQMKKLYSLLDLHWEGYYKQFTKAKIMTPDDVPLKDVESSFAMLLKEVDWLPAAVVKDRSGVTGERRLGRELYIRCPETERLLAYHVPYLDIQSPPQSSFCQFLGVRTKVEINEVKDLLISWCTPEEDSTTPRIFETPVGHIKTVYKYLLDNLPAKILQDLLYQHPLIFYTDIQHNLNDVCSGQFFNRDQVRWADPSGLFDKYKDVIKTSEFQKCCKTSIFMLYPEQEFKDLFTSGDRIQKHPDCEEYAKLLVELCSILPPQQALPDVLKIFTLIGKKVIDAKDAGHVPSSIMTIDLEKTKLLIKDERIFPVKGNKWVYHKDIPMVADDNEKEKRWKSKPHVYFIDNGEGEKRRKLTGLNGVEQEKVSAFLEYMGIRKVTDSEDMVTTTDLYKPCPPIQLYVHRIIPYMQMLLYHDSDEIYDQLIKDNMKNKLACMQFAQVSKLEMVYHLKTLPDTLPVIVNEKCRISDKEFTVHEDSIGAYNDINNEIARYFSRGNKYCFKGIKNLLLEMMPFITDETKDLNDYLAQIELKNVPEGEELWEVPAPLNWPPKPPTPPPFIPSLMHMPEPVYETPVDERESEDATSTEQMEQKPKGLMMWPPPERSHSTEYRPPISGDKPRSSVWPPPAPPEYMDHTNLPDGLRPSKLMPHKGNSRQGDPDTQGSGDSPPSSGGISGDGDSNKRHGVPTVSSHVHIAGTGGGDGKDSNTLHYGTRSHDQQHPLVIIPPKDTQLKVSQDSKMSQLVSNNTINTSDMDSFATAREEVTVIEDDEELQDMDVQTPVVTSTPEGQGEHQQDTQGAEPSMPQFGRSQSQIEMEYITTGGGQEMINVDENWIKNSENPPNIRRFDRAPLKRLRTESHGEDSSHYSPRRPVIFYGNPVWSEGANESVYESLADGKDIVIPEDISTLDNEAPPEIGKWGEKLVNSYLQQSKEEEDSDICDFIWVNEEHETGLPYDFVIKVQDPQNKEIANVYIELQKQLKKEKELYEMKLKQYRDHLLTLKKRIFSKDDKVVKQKIRECCNVLDEIPGKASSMGLKVNNGYDLNQINQEDAVLELKDEAKKSQKVKEHHSSEVMVKVFSKNNKQSCNNNNINKVKFADDDSDMTTIATQTDDVVEGDMFEILDPQLAAYQMLAFNGHGSFSPEVDFGLTELELASGLEFYEQPFDIEYRELTLKRASVQEKVGLTLCYENHEATEDEITDIYVSEIEPGSIAAKCGDIREGDQILQINGVEVRSRADAIQLFSENRADITLLIARPVYQVDDGFMEDRGDFDDDFRLLDQGHRGDFTETCSAQGEECASTDTGSTEKSRNDKDSGVGRTDESTKNDESSEQDVECTSPGHNIDPDHHCSNDSFTSNETQENDNTSAEQLLLQECNSFREALETRCILGDSGGALLRIDSQSSIEREIDALNKEMEQIQLECQQIYEAHRKDPQKTKVKGDNASNKSPSRSVPRMGTRLEYIRQLNALQQDGAVDPVWVRHEHCTNMGTLLQSHSHSQHPKHIILPLDSSSSKTTPTNNASHINIPFPNGQCNGIKDKDNSTTSAYNTGDSCRSTPLTLELTHIQNDKGQKQPLLSLSVPVNKNNEGQNSHVLVNEDHKDIVNGSESISRTSQTPEPPAGEDLQEVYSQYAEVMYTNQANLQHTIMVQQRLFQQKMLQQQQESGGYKSHESSPKHSFDMNNASNASPKHNHNIVPAPFNSSPKHMTLMANPGVNGSLAAGGGNESSGANNSAVAMEWVVKRRADGTRYITRRPMRSKFLKERAKKISEERSGMTTDDDAMSELKCGRYWTKEDRKRHLEKAKEYKRRKQEMLRRKMETLKEIEEKKKEPNILELSHRKMMKHKSKKAFDDFTTVQEMLVHGSRGQKGGVETSPSKTTTANPLLSVTTV